MDGFRTGPEVPLLCWEVLCAEDEFDLWAEGFEPGDFAPDGFEPGGLVPAGLVPEDLEDVFLPPEF